MAEQFILAIATIVLALIFDLGNGLNDAANSIATVVATRALTFRGAALLAMVFNILAAFVFSIAVATTIGKGIVVPEAVDTLIIFSGLIGSIIWVYVTTHYGIPISASHSLIGGLIGAAFTAVGWKALVIPGIIKVIIFIVLAPLIGLVSAAGFITIIYWIFRKSNAAHVNKHFKWLQLISASMYSLNHGANDAQKTVGIISLVLFINGMSGPTFTVPYWVIIISHLVIGIGTLLGGWKVVKTMGLKITTLRPVHGFAAETSGALTIFICSIFGIPVSTTHVICGSITGIGMTRRQSAVRWILARRIVWAWILTIPTAAIMGGGIYLIIAQFL